MSSYMDNKWSWIDGSHQLRDALLDSLTDSDLAFNPGGKAMSLGALCREMGDVQHAYLQSVKTGKTDFSYRHTTAGIEGSISQLKAWFRQMDDDMKATLSALSDADFQKMIDRASGYQMPLELQLDVYLQALLIFFGKATVYMKIMEKTIPPMIVEYIG
ncbi:MAG: DinB family protein [Chloroflexi bacterium]|nr:DinB family protein [Chloroflexota bacterium]MCC6894370.1 DinB family protein [Anaerolineae bacterium]